MNTVSKLILGAAGVAAVGTAVGCRLMKKDDFFKKTNPYNPSDALTVEKKADKEFKVLQLTDLQISDGEKDDAVEEAYEMIKDLVKRSEPDLIVMTGDNAIFNTVKKYEEFADFMDSFNIPFTFAFGNHENESRLTLRKIASIISKKKNCLFKPGFKNVSGVGNFVINVTQNGDVKYSFFMFDSHNCAVYLPSDKKTPLGGTNYAYLKKNQIEWYEHTVKGIRDSVGHDVNSLAFFHIPVPEYRYYKPENAFIGEKREDICSPYKNTGFFEKVKELKSTKGIFVGHDHRNNFAFEHDGIILAYGLKTGRTCYYDDDMQGGLVIRFDKDMTDFSIEHLYYDCNTK